MQRFLVKIDFEHLNAAKSLSACFIMALFYVVSLYIWSKKNRFNRDEPQVLIRRFISVLFSCVCSLILVYCLSQYSNSDSNNIGHTINEWVGFKFDVTAIKALLLGSCLTIILFIGPLVQDFMNIYLDYKYVQQHSKAYIDPKLEERCSEEIYSIEQSILHDPIESLERSKSLFNMTFGQYFLTDLRSRLEFAYILECSKDLVIWRDYLVSPLTEEFVFRSCMIPLVFPFIGEFNCVMVIPLFFGIAHLHHIIEGFVVNKLPLEVLIGQHLFQFSYTYLFGVYSTFLFIRTGSFYASFVSHVLCNYMGFPNINELMHEFEKKAKYFILVFYFVGFLSFFGLINFLTVPVLYGNTVFVST